MSYYQRVSRVLLLSQSTSFIDLCLRRRVGTFVKLDPELMPMLVQSLFINRELIVGMYVKLDVSPLGYLNRLLIINDGKSGLLIIAIWRNRDKGMKQRLQRQHFHLQGQQNGWWKEKEAAEICHPDWALDSGPGWLTLMGCGTGQLPNRRGTTVNCQSTSMCSMRPNRKRACCCKMCECDWNRERKAGQWVAGFPLICCIGLWKIFPPSCIPGVATFTLLIQK